MILEDAETVVSRATWVALCRALDGHRDTAAALRRVARVWPRTSVEYQDAERCARAAREQVQICWQLHFGKPRPA